MKFEYRKGYLFSILEENEWIDVEVETYGKGKIKTVEIHDSRLIRYGIEFDVMPSHWNLEQFGNMYFTINEFPISDQQRISDEFHQHLTAYRDIGTV